MPKKSTSSLTTTPDSITVTANSGLTGLGIAAPIDSSYAAARLSVTVTGLPNDGTVFLPDGVTPVYRGETLTVAQLTGLKFKATPGLFGTSSTFTYRVADPAGSAATGTATLSIAPDSLPPATTAASLTVAENSGATGIGIMAPIDANYAASALKIQVTGLPNDGTVLLPDGTTPVLSGQLLTVAQLTGLQFKPLSGIFGTSSAFNYNVINPSGLTTSGTAALSIGPDTLPPSTTPASLTVSGDSGPTPIGIAPPTDPNYSAGQLTITVAGLPMGGSVVLLDGVTPVQVGETLTVAQLTSLQFDPTPGTFSSTFNYTVKDPSGLTANGTATLATTASGTATISPDGSILTIGAAGSLVSSTGTWTFSPNTTPYGHIILLNGQSAAGGSAVELEVANNGNLYADNNLGQWFQWGGSNWNITTNPTAPASTVTIDPPAPPLVTSPPSSSTSSSGGLWQDPSSVAASAPGIDSYPTLQQPSQPGDIVGVRLQNPGTATESSGYVTFGELFRAGSVHPGDSLVARIGGVNYAVQMDVKSTNADGSVRQAVLTLQAPSITAGGTLDLMLATGTAAGPSTGAPSISALLANGYDTTVSFTFHNADGSTTTDHASGASALQAALSAGTVRNWLSGPQVNEYDVVTTVDGGKLKVEFDIRAYANGTTTTDVIFDNSWFFTPGRTDLNYDVAINQGGQQVYAATGVQQYLYSTWDHEVNGAGAISPNVQYDVPYLMATGAVQSYDTSYGVSDAAIQYNAGGISNAPMSTGNVLTLMGEPGPRQDIAPEPNWTAQWLLSQNPTAFDVMMADGQVSGTIPWHYTDENTGHPISGKTYSNIFGDTNPVNGFPQYGVNGDNWQIDLAHEPDLNYLPYLVTGSHYQLDLLQAQANYSIIGVWGYGNAFDSTGTVPTGFAASFNNWQNVSNGNQLRAVAWELREVAEAAYLTPNSDPLSSYFINQLNVAMNGLVQEYITDNINGPYGQLNGFVQGSTGPTVGQVFAWQQDYLVTSLAEIAGMNIPGASANAVQMLQYMNNFVSGLYTNGPNGLNPLDGAFYWAWVNDPTTGTPFTTWAQLSNYNTVTDKPWNDGYPGLNPNPTTLIGHVAGPANFGGGVLGGYPEIAKAALADEITYTQSPQAIQAYGFVVSQTVFAYYANETADYQSFPQWSIVPRLPDGVLLENSQMQIDVSGASNVTLNASGGDSLLAVVGNGSATLNGGNGTVDLMFGGTGTTNFNPGPGNDYLFAAYNATGTQTFNDNTGNNYMYGSSSGPNVYVFTENNSGHDTIANFNVNTDHLRIASNLNGNGITSASQLIASVTVSSGNAIFHLSPQNDITLIGINQPSSLINSILVS